MAKITLAGVDALTESGGVVSLTAAIAVDAVNVSGVLPVGVTGGSGLDAVPAPAATAGQILQVQAKNSGSRPSSTSTSWYEPSADFRVAITPNFTNSLIILLYHMPFNQSSAANILTDIRTFRTIGGGSKSYVLTSSGNAGYGVGSMAGGCIRPGNGYDTNDQQIEQIQVMDRPGTTSECIYGIEFKPEGSATIFYGYSNSSNGTWGYDTDIVITATEVKQ
jgi:hypothetical protein